MTNASNPTTAYAAGLPVPPRRSHKLDTASDIRVFVAGRTITHVVEPLDDHVRFVFTDGSSLLVVTAGREVGYYAEPALLN